MKAVVDATDRAMRAVEMSVATYGRVKAAENKHLATDQMRDGWLQNHHGGAIEKYQEERRERKNNRMLFFRSEAVELEEEEEE